MQSMVKHVMNCINTNPQSKGSIKMAKVVQFNPKARGALNLKQSYNFIDKTPIIDELRTALEDLHLSYKEIADRSGVSPTTIHNWFSGKTKRPQVPTLNAVGRLVGWQLKWVRGNG